jgi:hypothetical protein
MDPEYRAFGVGRDRSPPEWITEPQETTPATISSIT